MNTVSALGGQIALQVNYQNNCDPELGFASNSKSLQ
jgi:hypothetical protein